MANLGSTSTSTTFNCFTSHPRDIGVKDPDSIVGIFDALGRQAKILSGGGGYGTNLSYIRPNGSYIAGIGTRTPGVVKFMGLWDKSSETITMGSEVRVGKVGKKERKYARTGAQMLVLNVWHPDILEFIKAKQLPGNMTKANLSVGITEGFMEVLKADGMWDLRFPDTGHKAYKTEWAGSLEEWDEKQYPTITYKTLRAKELWETLMLATYTRNEPGVIFLDLVNKLNPMSVLAVKSL
jgi:ribonucleoside-diphosphate reductase alpha chain